VETEEPRTVGLTGLARTIVAFCRFTRTRGLSGGVQETLAALRAAKSLGIARQEDLKAGLRSVLCSSKEEWDIFGELFEIFWNNAQFPNSNHPPNRRESSAPARNREGAGSLMSGAAKEESWQEVGSQAVTGASARERLRKADFSLLNQNDQAVLEQIAMRLLKQMSLRRSRSRRIANSRGKVDLRRTIRRSIGRGGEWIDLRYLEKETRPKRLVILLDISGSMSPYSLFLIRFVYALKKHFKRVDAFVFSTELVEITGALRAHRLPDALHALSQVATGWSGGTKIGASLGKLNRLHTRKLRSGDTLFLILSDGLDAGEPEQLAVELQYVRRRVRKLIWLNPLLGLADYQPLARGMRAALPYVDLFAPAHNLESLLALEKHL
jgi:uncharacterized protein with von Willebrand factor type A (vWA) domain